MEPQASLISDLEEPILLLVIAKGVRYEALVACVSKKWSYLSKDRRALLEHIYSSTNRTFHLANSLFVGLVSLIYTNRKPHLVSFDPIEGYVFATSKQGFGRAMGLTSLNIPINERVLKLSWISQGSLKANEELANSLCCFLGIVYHT